MYKIYKLDVKPIDNCVVMNDDIILEKCFKKYQSTTTLYSNKLINGAVINKLETEEYNDIRKYLNVRFADIPAVLYANDVHNYYREILWRINHKIEKRPICLICGKPVKFTGKVHYRDIARLSDNMFKDEWASILSRIGFEKTCDCKECKNTYASESSARTMKKRYGIKYAFMSEDCKERRLINSRKSIHERSIKYNAMKEIMFKDKHDIEYYRERKLYLDLIEAYDKTTAMIEKCNESNKHNFNIGTSKEELKILDILQKEFNDVVHQYKSKKYNHKCDFYIPSLDLYIEYQGFYTHGTHPYNVLNENDKQILDKLKYKADNSINESNCYNKIITNWTINDVRKREEAKENKLNYLEIFNKIAFEAIPDIVKHEFSNNIKNKQLVIGI